MNVVPNSGLKFSIVFFSRNLSIQSSFDRLYLHTVSQPVRIPKELAAYSLTLCFHMTLSDLEEIFLSRFMIKEKPHIDAEQYTLLQVCLFSIVWIFCNVICV